MQHGEKKDGFSPNDYERFDLYVACVDEQFDWDQLDAPYHDPEIIEKRNPPHKAFNKYKMER